ncbi:MAG: hypothetical protein EZS28_014873 [Streblomastix strix]|uniref:Uncharacterized protein n=1 Tax=Streblomastix strix TaxID=222440 RepID=A0A5J4W3P7_9EUKA|nr:MAG: hypothetical protein EZS28_014873 [Streblomastix strix]
MKGQTRYLNKEVRQGEKGVTNYYPRLPWRQGHPIGRIPVREPTVLEPQWYLNKEVRQGDTGITNQNF